MDLIKLKILRKQKKISLTKMAELTNLSKATCYNIENQIGNPSIDSVEKYIKILDFELRLLLIK